MNVEHITTSLNSPTIRLPETDLPRVVVIGDGFAGLAVVRGLRKANVQLVMFDRYNYHTFQPLLYQVATAGLEPDSVAGPLQKIFRKPHNFHFRTAEVVKIDPDSRCVETSIGSLKYDYLVLAYGSTILETRILPNTPFPSSSFLRLWICVIIFYKPWSRHSAKKMKRKSND